MKFRHFITKARIPVKTPERRFRLPFLVEYTTKTRHCRNKPLSFAKGACTLMPRLGSCALLTTLIHPRDLTLVKISALIFIRVMRSPPRRTRLAAILLPLEFHQILRSITLRNPAGEVVDKSSRGTWLET